MNKFHKICPNVWGMKSTENYKRGDLAIIETKHGKEVEVEVYNVLSSENNIKIYSIVRTDSESYAERKARKYGEWADARARTSNEYFQASNESADFLRLAEPIKVGHHSECKHRALIEHNRKCMDKCVEHDKAAQAHALKAEYWEKKAEEITLADPDCLEYFETKLSDALDEHGYLKNNPDKRPHDYALQYAKKAVDKMKKKVEMAKWLWGGGDASF